MRVSYRVLTKCGRLLHSGQRIRRKRNGEIVVEGEVKATDTFSMRWSAAENLFSTTGDLGVAEWKTAQSEDEDNAEREAFELRVQASNLGSQASLILLRTRQVGLGPDPRFTTALTGAGSILGNFAVFRKNKII